MIHAGNFLVAMPYVTPAWIEPEWYFLPFYAVLRAVPHKLGGTVALVLAIVVLALLPLVLPNAALGRRLVSKALAAKTGVQPKMMPDTAACHLIVVMVHDAKPCLRAHRPVRG